MILSETILQVWCVRIVWIYAWRDNGACWFTASPEPIELTLTNQWLWEIIDEFVYQFQSFSQFRRSPKLNSDELTYIKDHNYIWSVLSVLNVLHALIEKSNINQQLKAYFTGENAETVAGEFGRSPLYKMLGYFSLIALLRVHSMLGDYHLAVKVLENVDLHKNVSGFLVYSYYPTVRILSRGVVAFETQPLSPLRPNLMAFEC